MCVAPWAARKLPAFGLLRATFERAVTQQGAFLEFIFTRYEPNDGRACGRRSLYLCCAPNAVYFKPLSLTSTIIWASTRIALSFLLPRADAFISILAAMRPLTEEETTKVFEKLAKFMGPNLKMLLDGAGSPHCFRLQKDRVYYVSEDIMRRATNVSRDHLASLGTCFGKFTHHKNFHLHISCLDYMARYAKHKVWVKPSSEMSYLYGNHILKTGLGRITENTPQGTGVVVYNMNDMPLGFGLTARSTMDCRKASPTDIIVLHQADMGMYLRDEDKSPASAL
jgi:60S ribosome subunit biogenesis protein NIP7